MNGNNLHDAPLRRKISLQPDIKNSSNSAMNVEMVSIDCSSWMIDRIFRLNNSGYHIGIVVALVDLAAVVKKEVVEQLM